MANSNSGPTKPFLEKIVLCTGGDPNPILSFSLNKYDAVVLTSINDLEYARRNLTQNASLQEIPGERYFLACASEDEGFRAFLNKQINKADMLRNVAKAEGATINSVVMDNLESVQTQITVMASFPQAVLSNSFTAKMIRYQKHSRKAFGYSFSFKNKYKSGST